MPDARPYEGTPLVVRDDQATGQTACAVLVPAGWESFGYVDWSGFGHTANQMLLFMGVREPSGAARLEIIPNFNH